MLSNNYWNCHCLFNLCLFISYCINYGVTQPHFCVLNSGNKYSTLIMVTRSSDSESKATIIFYSCFLFILFFLSPHFLRRKTDTPETFPHNVAYYSTEPCCVFLPW